LSSASRICPHLTSLKLTPSRWKAVAAGLSYVTKSGKTCDGRRAMPCKRKCSDRVSDTERREIADRYYSMDENSRNSYLF